MKAYIEENPPVKLLKYLGGLFKARNNFPNILLTSRGRDAIQLVIDFLQIKSTDSVLLPALICDTVTGAFSNNCNMIFYDLKKDYSIDPSILEHLLDKNSEIKIIYVIHYFGFIQSNMQEISCICEKYGVFLIEDHAHSALSNFDKRFADAHIYSFRKLLPTADGGGVQMKGDKIRRKFRISHKLIANIKGLAIAFKRVGSLYSKRMRSLIGNLIQNDINRLNNENSSIDPLPVSIFGKGVIGSSNIDIMCSKRCEKYKKWKNLFDTTPFESLFPDLSGGTVPFGFPIKLKNSREILSYFKTYNIFLKVHWPSLPPNTKDSCPVSHHLANTSITLPVYPGLRERNMRFIRDEILKYGIPLGKC